jgi:hypothetical protein
MGKGSLKAFIALWEVGFVLIPQARSGLYLACGLCLNGDRIYVNESVQSHTPTVQSWMHFLLLHLKLGSTIIVYLDGEHPRDNVWFVFGPAPMTLFYILCVVSCDDLLPCVGMIHD